ncbi:MAG: aldo/keto reductase [Chloroflexi bacterium]|nr:aldo/keto reductase [Chloroflexota bacterium]
MNYTILGRTGLKVSAMGLGCGGPSRLGKKTGKSEAESVAIIRQARDSGVNFIDTAARYGTEEIIGKAIKEVGRSWLVLSTKMLTTKMKQPGFERITPEEVQKGLDDSLRLLGTDYVDIYHFHGVLPRNYDYVVSEIVPTFQKMRAQGKIRFIGITESFDGDPQHTMLQRAVEDDIWDVMLVGFNMLNQSARERVFRRAMQKNIGIVVMFAVRLALSRPERLRQLVKELVAKKHVNPSDIDENNPLGFLLRAGGAVSLTDAAYRFCHYEPGTHVILSGTGNPDHLQANIESFSRPALPHEDLVRLRDIFENVDSVSGD